MIEWPMQCGILILIIRVEFISDLQPVLEAGVQVIDVLVNEAGELEMLLSPLGRLLALGLIIMFIINFLIIFSITFFLLYRYS